MMAMGAPEPFEYEIVIAWSPDDGAYVARVPALGIACAAHGSTPEAAAREVVSAAITMMDVMRENGDPLPPPHGTASRR
jgi:predicted RNase H-like HicB family nuclease